MAIFLYVTLALILAFFLWIVLWSMKPGADNTGSFTLVGFFLTGIAALIYLIARRIRNRSRYFPTGKENVLPTYEQSQKFVLVLGLGSVAIGILTLLNPSGQAGSSYLLRYLSDLLGPLGPPLFFIGGGIYLVYLGSKDRDRNK